jgi:hypothetical protein
VLTVVKEFVCFHRDCTCCNAKSVANYWIRLEIFPIIFEHTENKAEHNLSTLLQVSYSFKDEAQTALFKDPVRTAL